MKIKCKVVYQFDELSERAKERARDWWRDGGLDYEWWDSTYEDAERAGLKIKEFGLDRDKHVNGDLIVSPAGSIKAILVDHGEDCETFKMAKQFKAGLKLLDSKSEDYEQELERFTEEYTESLCEEYASILQAESEYLMSDEHVDESIRCNEYDFTEEGKRYV